MVRRGLPKKQVLTYLPIVLVEYLDKRVEKGEFENRSHAISSAIRILQKAEA